jgi:hypothetical protein
MHALTSRWLVRPARGSSEHRRSVEISSRWLKINCFDLLASSVRTFLQLVPSFPWTYPGYRREFEQKRISLRALPISQIFSIWRLKPLSHSQSIQPIWGGVREEFDPEKVNGNVGSLHPDLSRRKCPALKGRRPKSIGTTPMKTTLYLDWTWTPVRFPYQYLAGLAVSAESADKLLQRRIKTISPGARREVLFVAQFTWMRSSHEVEAAWQVVWAICILHA